MENINDVLELREMAEYDEAIDKCKQCSLPGFTACDSRKALANIRFCSTWPGTGRKVPVLF